MIKMASSIYVTIPHPSMIYMSFSLCSSPTPRGERLFGGRGEVGMKTHGSTGALASSGVANEAGIVGSAIVRQWSTPWTC